MDIMLIPLTPAKHVLHHAHLVVLTEQHALHVLLITVFLVQHALILSIFGIHNITIPYLESQSSLVYLTY